MNPSRHIELDIDIGADARDWSAIQAQEKLKPVETELRRIEELVNEIVSEMDYLRSREQKLRDTNESTNERVKWFAFGTMGMLVGLGAWQVVYLRAYFRYVELFPSPGQVADMCTTAPSILSRQQRSVRGSVVVYLPLVGGLQTSSTKITICISPCPPPTFSSLSPFLSSSPISLDTQGMAPGPKTH